MADCNLLISYNKRYLEPFNSTKHEPYQYFAKLASYPKLSTTSSYDFFRNLMRKDFEIKTKISSSVFNLENTPVLSNICFDMVITKEQFLENINIYTNIISSGNLSDIKTQNTNDGNCLIGSPPINQEKKKLFIYYLLKIYLQ